MRKFQSNISDPSAVFKVPESYFEEFPDRVMNLIDAPERKTILINRYKWIYAAAAILILAVSILMLQRMTPQSNELSEQELITYLSTNSLITDEDLVNLLETEDIAKIEIEYPIEDKTVEELLLPNVEMQQLILE